MLVLGVDTSGNHGSIALGECSLEEGCRILEVVPLAGGTFSAQLIPQIAGLLEKHHYRKSDIGAFSVASGPGSFTGLRVGLAAIKGLAEILGKPIAAVSLLEAVAVSANAHGNVLSALDAGRHEVYAGTYEIGEAVKRVGEHLHTAEEFSAAANGYLVVTPDQSVADVASMANLKYQHTERPRSDAIVSLGWKKILMGETVSPETLDANYIRRSDAEIFSKPRV
jgi:tRNA threonylcarbamoyladenosine biosynthesis protein TsaB